MISSILRIASEEDLLCCSLYVGHSFEAFVMGEILKGLTAKLLTKWQAFYCRSGVEIDLILDGPFGTLPIEIHMAQLYP